ncbi:V-type ATP synthase subunit A [Sulfurovum riftiae]|uniref:V-type ATP synthase alpha chain n=1 Tax=Sulfurovum riftiae TaxID=1630136 RepID=A0A151CGA3_9BACT|nr:V-type ATP synthase subunit A [Sulfurovum riftiae]KYJ86546.1 ATP synthase subunit A [Sulfurovum riftiae]
MASIISISGPIVNVGLEGETVRIQDVVYVGDAGLTGEVIQRDRQSALVQVYEETEGLKIGEKVRFTGEMLSALLGPGLLGSIYDGIQRPLKLVGTQMQKGLKLDPLDREEAWDFIPSVEVGQKLQAGEQIGVVSGADRFEYRILVPPGKNGTVRSVVKKGEYRLDDTLVELENGEKISMLQRWPVRMARPFKERVSSGKPMITGQRIIDFLFPISEGGSASIPGGFGTGKTILQQTLAKWSDADIIVYIGCGERGNEMTEVLQEFPQLEDPKTGKRLIERTVLIANTSDMPVSAREASIYMGLTIAEYFRDMGYTVALMADSTSRWAEAMRELSGRMNELPAEEGFPSYLASRIASVYERAGAVKTLGGGVGALTMIGAVSPPGGDFSEPVTRYTQRFTSVFWALDKELANARFYPSINHLQSHSAYARSVKPWWETISPHWETLRIWLIELLQKDEKLQRIVKLLGTEALPEDQKLTLFMADLIKEFFLQQNAFDAIDMYASPQKQVAMVEALNALYRQWEHCYEAKGIPVTLLKEQGTVQELLLARQGVRNEELEWFDSWNERMEAEYETLLLEFGEVS